MVDFRGFEHSDVEERGRGGGNKQRGVQKRTHGGWGTKKKEIFYSLNIPKKVDFRGTCPRGPGKVGTSIGESKKAKIFLSRFERGQRLPAAARGCPFTRPAVDRFFYSLNIPKKADFRVFKHSDVPEGARGGVNKYRGVQKSKKNVIALRAGPAAARGCPWLPVYPPCCGSFFSTASTYSKWSIFGVLSTQSCRRGPGKVGTSIGSGSPKKQKNFYRASSGASGCPRLPVAARLPALLWIVFFYSLNIPKMVDFRGFKHLDVPEGGRGSGNKHRGVQKKGWGPYLKRVTATPAVDPSGAGCLWLPVYPPCCGSLP
ncbi:hypothetical protein ACOMHN_066363 [Nucella lapillus]